ncbi:MAG: AAA family ATPase [Bauldia litoralis]
MAVTGTHGSGKTTLVEDFLDTHRHYEHAQEPYWDLAEQGVAFPDAPTIDGFTEQLEHSVRVILGSASEADMIFDRCPLDFIAYLEVLGEKEGVEWTPSGKLLARIEAALSTLDLIAWLPLSQPDEIRETIDYPKLRQAVDTRLAGILRDDDLGLLEQGPRIVEIGGSRPARLARLVEASA